MMYDLGPLLIRTQAWPASWTASANRWLRTSGESEQGEQSTDGASVVTVSFAGLGVAPEHEATATTIEELLRLQRRGPSQWLLTSAGSFTATLDEHTRHLAIRARSEHDDPALALGNALRGLVATTLPNASDGLMLHACAGIHEGAGVVVAGVSTAGKTTLALDLEHTTYLGDDVAIVTNTSSAPTLVPSPFFGAAGVRGADVRAPLAAIGILTDKVTTPGARSSYQRVSRTRGAFELLRHVARFTDDRELSARLFHLAGDLAERVPVVLVRRSLIDRGDDVMRAIVREARC